MCSTFCVRENECIDMNEESLGLLQSYYVQKGGINRYASASVFTSTYLSLPPLKMVSVSLRILDGMTF